jgi:hypothetical protein
MEGRIANYNQSCLSISFKNWSVTYEKLVQQEKDSGSTYLLSLLVWYVEVRGEHQFRNSFKTFWCRFVKRSHWRESLHKTTSAQGSASRNIPADLLNECHWFDR